MVTKIYILCLEGEEYIYGVFSTRHAAEMAQEILGLRNTYIQERALDTIDWSAPYRRS